MLGFLGSGPHFFLLNIPGSSLNTTNHDDILSLTQIFIDIYKIFYSFNVCDGKSPCPSLRFIASSV